MTFRRLPASPSFRATAVLLVALTWAPLVKAQGRATGANTPASQGTDTRSERARDKDKKKERGDEPEGALTARRPYRAVFGGASTRTDLTRTLDFTGSLGEAYDQDRLAETASPDVSQLTDSAGFYSALAGDLVFHRKGRRLETAVTGGTTARYYSDLQRFFATDYHVGGGVSAQLSRRTQLRLDQAFSYAPVDLLGLFASSVPLALGEAAPPTTDFAVNDNRSRSWVSSGQLARRMTARADLTMSGSVRTTRFLASRDGNGSFREIGAGAVYSYRLRPSASLRMGYSYRGAVYESTGPISTPNPAEHGADIGIDFHRALSASRRTTFTLRTGSTFIDAPLPSNTRVSSRQLRILVDSAVAHQMGETWQVVGSYHRGSGLIEGLVGPVFSDAWSVSANGFLVPRADFTSSVSYSTGEPSLAGTSQNFTTYTGNARLRVALNSHWALSTEYLRYFYDFSKTPELVRGIEPRFSRNLFRAGLSLWVPFGRR